MRSLIPFWSKSNHGGHSGDPAAHLPCYINSRHRIITIEIEGNDLRGFYIPYITYTIHIPSYISSLLLRVMMKLHLFSTTPPLVYVYAGDNFDSIYIFFYYSNKCIMITDTISGWRERAGFCGSLSFFSSTVRHSSMTRTHSLLSLFPNFLISNRYERYI